MKLIGAIIHSAKKIMPKNMQNKLIEELGTAETLEAAPAGAILMGMYILEYVGFPRYIDELLEEKHTTIEELRRHYQNRTKLEAPMIPSTGILISLMASDMIACPRNITRSYQYVEMATQWQTGPMLGIEPHLLTDDRLGRAMSRVGDDSKTMEEVLFHLIMESGKKAGIPLNRFIIDTTLLELDGKFKDAEKVVPGRGTNSFSQLLVSLIVASGSRLPVGFNVLAGNTNDASTLPAAYQNINRIADEGAVEILMDRIYPTPSNILFLQEKQSERMVYWISPLKMGLSEKRVREVIDKANQEEKWAPIKYRSTREIKADIATPLTAFESTWVLKETIKPELKEGQTRRPKGSSQTVEIETRCVFYRHAAQAEQDKKNREKQIEKLQNELQEFSGKLNRRNLRDLTVSQKKLDQLLKEHAGARKFVACSLIQNANDALVLTWEWNDTDIAQEENYDGIFALLTNYSSKQVGMNQLVSKYRSRDQIEVDFKEMKGLLDLERILYHRSERIECYVFIKVISLFVLTFLRSMIGLEGVKTTEKNLQESMGDMLIVENVIEPMGLKNYAIGRDTELNRRLRARFQLPDPVELIRVLNDAEYNKVDEYVQKYYDSKKIIRNKSQ